MHWEQAIMGITLAQVIAILTVAIGILVKVVGFPDQIRMNYRRKSTAGLSIPLMVLSMIGYLLWTVHGVLQGDWVLIVGQGLGIVTAGTILVQVVVYRNK